MLARKPLPETGVPAVYASRRSGPREYECTSDALFPVVVQS